MMKNILGRSAIHYFFFFIPLWGTLLIHLNFVNAECSIKETSQSHVELGSSAPLCALEHLIIPINQTDNYTPLINKAGKAHFVLIGDSTHGSHEFYLERINISKRLIKEKNFTLIAIEAEWPNVQRLNEYIHGLTPSTAIRTIAIFNQYPDWVWKNKEMLEFIEWLREHNSQVIDSTRKVSIYGMDLYSFNRSRKLVIEYLQKVSDEAASLAEQRYDCFSAFHNDLHQYGQTTSTDRSLTCEHQAKQQYLDFAECRIPCPDANKSGTHEDFFQARHNALIIQNVEKYFRVLYEPEGDVLSWNERDQHMLESINVLQKHLGNPKTLLWAHSSHLGNALATDMPAQGEVNLGQLIRHQYPNQVFSIGMLSYAGEVTASDGWGSPAKIKTLLPALPESNSGIFHRLGVSRFLLFLQEPLHVKEWLNSSRLQRHVGVVYLPDEEVERHYSYTHLADQFDAVFFIDITTPLGLLSTD